MKYVDKMYPQTYKAAEEIANILGERILDIKIMGEGSSMGPHYKVKLRPVEYHQAPRIAKEFAAKLKGTPYDGKVVFVKLGYHSVRRNSQQAHIGYKVFVKDFDDIKLEKVFKSGEHYAKFCTELAEELRDLTRAPWNMEDIRDNVFETTPSGIRYEASSWHNGKLALRNIDTDQIIVLPVEKFPAKIKRIIPKHTFR